MAGNMSGQHSKWRFFQESGNGLENIFLKVKSWEVGPNVTKIADGTNGDDRDDLQTLINSFDAQIVCWMPSAQIIDKMIDNIDNIDSGVVPLEKSVGLLVYPLDGTKKGYVGRELTIDDWKWASSGRTERQLITIPMRFRRFGSVPTL